MYNGLVLNWNVYVDGNNYIGKTTKFTPPKITVKTIEQYGAGMSAPIDMDTGRVEKMEATAEIDGIHKDIIKAIGRSDVALLLRAKIRKDGGEPESVLVELRGYITELDKGDFEPDSKGKTNIKMSVNYYKLTVAGDELVEIDPMNGIRNISGVNQMASIL